MKAPTFLQWWTSHETDDRTRMIRHADGDREAMFDLVRKAFYAGRQTAQLAAPASLPNCAQCNGTGQVAHRGGYTACYTCGGSGVGDAAPQGEGK